MRFATIPGTDIQPFNALARTFSAPLAETRTRTAQPFARELFEARTAAQAEARKEISGSVDDLVRAGHATDQEADQFRAWLENTHVDPTMAQRVGQVPPELRGIVAKLQARQASLLAEQAHWGVDPAAWTSPYARHWPRHATEIPGRPGSGAGSWSTFRAATPEMQRRLQLLSPYTDQAGVTHAIHGETATIKRIVQDPQLDTLKAAGATLKQRADYIKATYGNLVPEKYQVRTATGPAYRNRYEALARWIDRMDPDLKASGVFGNHPLVDFQAQLVHAREAVAASQAVRDVLASPEVLQDAATAARDTVPVARLLRALKIKPGDVRDGFAKRLAEGLGVDVDQLAQADPAAAAKTLRDLLTKRVPRDLARDLLHFREPFTSPTPVHEIVQAFDSVTNLFKGAVTSPWPAFHVRNFFSGQFQNYVGGMFSLRSVRDTHALLTGKPIVGAREFPIVQQLAAQRGWSHVTDAQATDLLGQLVYAQGLSHRAAGESLSVAGATSTYGPASLGATLEEIPGFGANRIQPGRIARKATFREPGTSFNPLRVRGVGRQVESQFGPLAAGDEVAGIVESFNRIAPFLHQLRRGVDPTAAATKVGAAQVMYQSRYYTPAEQQVFTRLFPFFKFSSRVMPWTIRQLAEQPSGRLAQTIRVANRLRNPDIMTPDYVAETMAVPLGQTPEGGQRYVTGLGLMHEDPLSFVGSGVRGALREVGSRLNPLAKMPIEWMTGQSLFQKGPMGGRPLEDLDPTIGRTLANLTGRREPVQLPQALEFVLANSPFARLATTARAATYPLRALTDPAMQGEFVPELGRAAVNLGTGLRITNVSPAAQDALLRERAQQLMRQAGGRNFVRSYIPEEVEATMTPSELEEARKLEALTNTLAKRSKARADRDKQR